MGVNKGTSLTYPTSKVIENHRLTLILFNAVPGGWPFCIKDLV
jgi:hypothetical protein